MGKPAGGRRGLLGTGALLRVDLSVRAGAEGAGSSGAARLRGTHEEGCTGGLRARPHSVVLFDEADKAHPKVLDLLLQVFDQGRIADGRGRVVDASHALFLLAANRLESSGDQGEGSPLRPEFLGRADAVLELQALDAPACRRIAEALSREAAQRLARAGVELVIASDVLDVLAALGDARLGARPIRARVDRDIVAAAADLLVTEPRPTRLFARCADDGRIHLTAGSMPR